MKALVLKEYRTLGRTGFKASDISTGGPGDEALLSALLDAGVNYIDNAESYWNGKCESIVGTVMKGRDRKKVFLTTKQVIHPYPGMPYKEEENTKEGIKKRFYKSLERMQTDYADCLMIHSVPDEKVRVRLDHLASVVDDEEFGNEPVLECIDPCVVVLEWFAPHLDADPVAPTATGLCLERDQRCAQ